MQVARCCRKLISCEHRQDATSRELDYLLAIYMFSEGAMRTVSVTKISEALGVKRSTAIESLRRLSSKGLILYSRGLGVRLTDEGRRVVEKLIYKHCILETFLTRFLGIDSETSCRLSSLIDKHVPDEVIVMIGRKIGNPRRCSCGLNIPSPDDK